MSDHHGRCGCDTYVTQNKTNKKKVTIQIFDKATSVKTIYTQSSGTCIPSHVPALVHYILDLNPSNRLRRDSFDCESIQSCNSPGEEKKSISARPYMHSDEWCFRGIYKGRLWEDDLHFSTPRTQTSKSSSHRPPLYMSRKHQSFTYSTTLQGPYPYQQI